RRSATTRRRWARARSRTRWWPSSKREREGPHPRGRPPAQALERARARPLSVDRHRLARPGGRPLLVVAGHHRGGGVAQGRARPGTCRDAQGAAGRGQPGVVQGQRRPGRAGSLLRGSTPDDGGDTLVASGAQVRFVAMVVGVMALASACIGSTQPVASTVQAVQPVIVPALDRQDQPSWSDRTGLPPALTLEGLFHPTYNVPV